MYTRKHYTCIPHHTETTSLNYTCISDAFPPSLCTLLPHLHTHHLYWTSRYIKHGSLCSSCPRTRRPYWRSIRPGASWPTRCARPTTSTWPRTSTSAALTTSRRSSSTLTGSRSRGEAGLSVCRIRDKTVPCRYYKEIQKVV